MRVIPLHCNIVVHFKICECHSFIIQTNPCDYKGHTLRIWCTELNAVPHAGLGFHFLRVQVRTTGSWRSSNGEMAQRRRKRTTDEQADDVPLASAVPKDIKRTSKLRGSWLSLMPFRKEGKSQVRQTDQVWYHDDMDGSSLARATHASMSPPL